MNATWVASVPIPVDVAGWAAEHGRITQAYVQIYLSPEERAKRFVARVRALAPRRGASWETLLKRVQYRGEEGAPGLAPPSEGGLVVSEPRTTPAKGIPVYCRSCRTTHEWFPNKSVVVMCPRRGNRFVDLSPVTGRPLPV